MPQLQKQTTPILLFNDECAVCRAIAGWVQRMQPAGAVRLVERPIGDDPEELRALFEGEFVDLIGGDQLDLGSLGKTASRHAGVTSRHAVVRGRR